MIETPLQSIFDDIKKNAIEIWNTYDNTYGYRTEKLNRIKDLENIRDNALYMVGMFDYQNQAKLFWMLEEDTKSYIKPYLFTL